MPGIVVKHGWSNYKLDENGAIEFSRKVLPSDLNKLLGKAVADLTKIYLEACRTNEAMAAGWGLVARPE